MKYNRLQDMTKGYFQNHRRNKRWHNIVTVLVCIVVFITTYMLIMPAITSEVIDLKEHLQKDPQSTLSVEIFDPVTKLPVTTVKEGKEYIFSFSTKSYYGYASEGIYSYKLPEGVHLEAMPAKDLIVNGEIIGIWKIDENGNIIFEFNDKVNSKQDVVISLSAPVTFDASVEEIEFDGKIHITVIKEEKPKQESGVTKYGNMKGGKISWTVAAQGGEGFPLPGQTVIDTITSANTYYGADDRHIWVEYYNGDILYGYNITTDAMWTEGGWQYTIPDKIICQVCNDPKYSVGNEHSPHEISVGDDWLACFYFSRTVGDNPEGVPFVNQIQVGEYTDTGKVFPAGKAGIVKKGELRDDKFHWTIDATIPGTVPDIEKPPAGWSLWDSTALAGPSKIRFPVPFDAPQKVTVTYQGATFEVKRYNQAGPDDLFAWNGYSRFDENGNAVGGGLSFLHRCHCTKDTCPAWAAQGRHEVLNGFCICWPETEDVIFHIEYDTPNSEDIISNYGGKGEQLRNQVGLENYSVNDKGDYAATLVASDHDTIPIPGIFNKEIIQEAGQDNKYTAIFKITVNEQHKNLSEMTEDKIKIVDTMSESLIYESGSMVIIATGVDGKERTLNQGDDYTLVSDGPHKLTITLLKPTEEMYTLHYRAFLTPKGVGSIGYDNAATVEINGITYTASSDHKVLTDFVTSADTYALTIHKTDSLTDVSLAGAKFGLYSRNGNLISSATTDENGQLIFQTDHSIGVRFLMNEPYYIQEIVAPPGFIIDDEKHWFYFADEENNELKQAYPGILGFFEHMEENVRNGEMNLTNMRTSAELPATGGNGEGICYGISAFTALAGMAILLGKFWSKIRKYRLRC